MKDLFFFTFTNSRIMRKLYFLIMLLIPWVLNAQIKVEKAYLDESGQVLSTQSFSNDVSLLSKQSTNIMQMNGFPKKVPVHPNFKNFRNVTLADLNGDGKQEILIPSMNQLRVFTWTGELLWSKTLTGTPIYPPSVAVMDETGTLGIVQVTGGVPNNGRVYYLDVNGNDFSGFPMSFSNHWIICAPALADVDADGNREIIVQTRTSNNLHVIKTDASILWTAPLGGTPAVTPSVADIDNDGQLDIVTATSDGNMHAFSADGSIKNGFPVPGQNYSFSYQSPLLVDFDGNNQLSIVGSTHGDAPQYYIRNNDGTYRSGWPVAVPDNSWTYAPPTVVDRSGNNDFEMFVGRPVGEDISPMLFGFHPDGSPINNFPIEKAGGLESFVSVADITGDGVHDLLFGSNLMVEGQGFIHAYKTDGSGEIEGFPLRPTGFTYMNGPSLGDVNGDGLLDLVAFSYELTFTPADSAYVNVYELNIPIEEADVLFGTYKGSNDRTGFVARSGNTAAVLPFTENWDSGSFSTNGWTFEPSQGNWAIKDIGNPAPSASFGWSPSTQNYSFTLISPTIDATQITTELRLQFDLMLDDYSNSGAEYLKVYVWNGGSWVLLASFDNSADIPWITKQFDITEHALGKLTKIKFEASGESTFDIDYWYVDNIQLFEDLDPGNPAISISPENMVFWVMYGGNTQTQPLTITNTGTADLEWSASILYSTSDYNTPIQHIESKETKSDSLQLSIAGAQPGGSPDIIPNDVVILNYDDDNADAIGLTNGGTFYVAARFPSAMTYPYADYLLESVYVYTKDMPVNSILKIWGQGTNNSPGALIHEQNFTPSSDSWKTIDLNMAYKLTGEDIWIGYSVTHDAGAYPAGCDTGPANPNGDWISTDGINWSHLAGYGLNYNWNIRAKINDVNYSWLTLNNYGGTILPSQSITVNCTSSTEGGLQYGFYHAAISISSNDISNPIKTVLATLHVVDGVNDNPFQNVKVQPVPARDFITIEQSAGELDRIRLFGTNGNLLYDLRFGNEKQQSLNISQYPPGLYTLQLIGKKGQTAGRRIMVIR